MGAYAIYSDKPFRAKGEIKRKRKRGQIDELMELLRNSHIEINEENQTFEIIKDIAVKENDS